MRTSGLAASLTISAAREIRSSGGMRFAGQRLDSGKWMAGPSFLLPAMPGRWGNGGLAAQIWSFAGDESCDDVNVLFSEVFVEHNAVRPERAAV